MISVLFIDDDVNLQKVFKMVLADEYRIIHAFTGRQGLDRLRDGEPDVVLLDINLPDINGIRVLKEITALPAAPPVIMVSAIQDTPLIVSAVKAGAYDYILKSSMNGYSELKNTIWQALENSGSYRYVKTATPFLDNIIGESPAIKRVKHEILCYAGSDSIVLIQGESGTGKELVAAALHRISHRNKGPFVPVNCGAIPGTLIETSLFGSEKGAYTDAVAAPGYFEKAHKGTIFLDEIGEMAPGAQVKLLRVLETKEFERVGGNQKKVADVRIIAATNRQLKSEIRQGNFREDLYYRLNVLTISVPSLRKRKEDIPLLAAFFVQQLSRKSKRLSPGAMEKLSGYSWPGNIRELRNVIERSIHLTGQDIVMAAEIILDED